MKNGEKVLESFKIFAQDLIGWLLVLGLKECQVECATVCIKSVVILKPIQAQNQTQTQTQILKTLHWT